MKNSKQKIINVFSEILQQDESMNLLYSPTSKHKKIVGLMLTSNINVALSLHNGTDLIFNQQSVFHGSQVSPDNRVIKLDEPINSKNVKGVVTGLQNNTRASVYLIIQSR